MFLVRIYPRRPPTLRELQAAILFPDWSTEPSNTLQKGNQNQSHRAWPVNSEGNLG